MFAGPVTQTCWVVPDVAAAEKGLSDLLGVRRWTRMEDIAFPAEDTSYRGEPTAFTAHVSLSYVGDLQLELIQPVAGTSVHTEFLDRSPEGGLHHVCVEVDDLDDALARSPWPVAQVGSMAGGAIRYAYLDGSAFGTPYVELAQIAPSMRGFYDHIKQESQ
jgi:catechol 2,3-dioxygenase-like lactoylglutathione lyase family enzyme